MPRSEPARQRHFTWSILALAAAFIAGAPSFAQADDGGRGSVDEHLGSSPQVPGAPLAIAGQTLRQVAHVSLGGDRVRVRFSNAFGTESLPITEARVAISAGGSAIVANTDRQLTFGIPLHHHPPGRAGRRRPGRLEVAPLANLAVNLYFPGPVSATTEHSLGVQTTYLSPAGNFANATSMPSGTTTTTSWYFLNGIEVVPRTSHPAAIVTLGDPITDGYASTVDANHRWPNFLAARLQARQHRRPRRGGPGHQREPGAARLHRAERAGAVRPGRARPVRGRLGHRPRGHQRHRHPRRLRPSRGAGDGRGNHRGAPATRRARPREGARNLPGATLTPFEGTMFPGYYTPEGEAKRQAVNHWIRTSGAYDTVIDFDKATREPAHPARLLPAYDWGDHLHPNDAGYQAMANAVDLSLF